jgi:C-terminal processing protease CtpA/Prc
VSAASAAVVDASPGLGFAVVKDSRAVHVLTVTAVFDRGPAWSAGLRVGDRISSLASLTPSDTPLAAIIAAANSMPAGTAVPITYSRDGIPHSISTAITRTPGAESAPRSVKLSCLIPTNDHTTAATSSNRNSNNNNKSSIKGNTKSAVGYIRLSDFGPSSADEIRTALAQQLQQTEQSQSVPLQPEQLQTEQLQPTVYAGLVLDVRDNPGGLLDQAVDIAAMLLPEHSPVVTIADAKGRRDTLYTEVSAYTALYSACHCIKYVVTSFNRRSQLLVVQAVDLLFKHCAMLLALCTQEAPLLPSNVPLILLVNGDTRSAAEVTRTLNFYAGVYTCST